MIKYQIPYRSYDDTAWRIDISLDAYSGDPINVLGVSEQVCAISWAADETDDPYAPIINSTAEINLYNEGQIDISEMQNAQDRDFIVQIYRAEVLYWQGFLIPDGIQQSFKSTPYNVMFSCTDGLSLLEKMPYSHNNLPGTTEDPTRCPMNYIRNILYSINNLNVKLPIHWTNSLQCTEFLDDMFTGQVTWSARGEGFSSYQTEPDGTTAVNYKTCDYILRGMLKSAQCNIKQVDGKWIIRRINDIVTGTFNDQSILADLDVMVITSEDIDVNKSIGTGGDYPFIGEDQVLTVRKAVSGCKVTYDANVRENILPNGNQDFVDTFSNAPFYWATPVLDDATYQSVPGIDGRGGSATDLTNPGDGTGSDSYFTTLSKFGSLATDHALPIDAYTLIKRVSFGFIFSPVNGFPYDVVTGIIDFSSNPLTIRIVYQNNDNTYYLDEFAIWRAGYITDIPIKVEGLKINDIVQVDFNRNNAIIIPKPTDPPQPGDMCELSVRFNLKDGQRYTVDYIYFNTDENNDVYEATYTSDNTALDERTLEISSSWGGYMLSNYMTYWGNSDDECFYKDGDFYTGTLTGLTAQAIMRFLYKSSIIYNGSMSTRGSNWSFDEIYSIDTLSDKKFLPLNATYNTETCEVNLIAIECRNDDISLSEKHYGTNDQTLSN